MANKPPAAPTINDVLKQAGIDPAAFAAAQQSGGGAANNNPFSSDTSNMPLYLGTQLGKPTPAAIPKGFPKTKPRGTKRYAVAFHGQTIGVTAPDYGNDVSVEVHTVAIKGKPVHGGGLDIKGVAPKDLRIEVQIKRKGQIIWRENLNNEQIAVAAGQKMGQHGKILEVQAGDVYGMAGTPGSPEDVTGTLEEELKKIYKYNPEQLSQLKTRLWLAGYYGDKKLEEINMRTIAQDDVAALSDVMLQASRYYSAGQKITWQDLLEQQAMNPAAKPGDKTSVTLTDTAKITKDANDMATQLIGHSPSPNDVQNLVRLIHGRETQYYETMAGGGTAEATDAAAQMDQYFRQTYPNETKATDWHDRAAVWQEMLKTPPAGAAPQAIEIS